MKEEFQRKLEQGEYISNHLFHLVEKNNLVDIPGDSNLDQYNEQVIKKDLQKYKSYFETMYQDIDKNIHLDEEQMRAILTDEDYSLIIAGAGTGKTTTMASKVKYLVDIKKIDPAKIVVMSYTRKATEELEKRILIDFGIPAHVTTFHSLGMMYIREVFKPKKCSIVDQNQRDNIFYQYFKEKIFPYPDRVKEIPQLFEVIKTQNHFVFGKHFMENFARFPNYEAYFEQYKKDKLNEVIDLDLEVHDKIEELLNLEEPKTIRNETVKSKGEAIIANFLYCNGIDYEYEKVYPELLEDNRTYRPDFTLKLGLENVYVEYFGLSTYPNDLMSRYEKIRKKKEAYHQTHHTRFIKIDSVRGEDILKTLKDGLLAYGFRLQPKSNKEIFFQLLDQLPIAQVYPYKNFLYRIIDRIKSSPSRERYKEIIFDYIKKLPPVEQKQALKQFKYINEFYCYYQKALYGNVDLYAFDFGDMIYYANLYINRLGYINRLAFDYLIIDEYQDISQERYEFTKKIAIRNHAKVVAVGDDWQSIFAFAGSKIKYIYNFQRYFEGAKLLRINHTYRNSQELIDYSGKFIMKNENQIKKDLISSKENKQPIRFCFFEPGEEYQTLKKLILDIHAKEKDHNILILARTNKAINECFRDEELRNDIGTKIEFIGYEDIEIDGMTIHKSKGLTKDEVIIIGLNKNFPNKNRDIYWLSSLFSANPEEEQIPFAEERRLFYVGLTRTKNNVYLLVNKDAKERSEFVNELYRTIKETDEEKKHQVEV